MADGKNTANISLQYLTTIKNNMLLFFLVIVYVFTQTVLQNGLPLKNETCASETYCYYTANSNTYFSYKIFATVLEGIDIDCYLGSTPNPTKDDYLLRASQLNHVAKIALEGTEIELIKNHDYYYGVYCDDSDQDCYYDIVFYGDDCDHDCRGHGTCNANVCQCSPGYKGRDCGLPYAIVQVGKASQVTFDDKILLFFSTPLSIMDSIIRFDFTLTEGENFNLFVRRDEFPDEENYDIKEEVEAALSKRFELTPSYCGSSNVYLLLENPLYITNISMNIAVSIAGNGEITNALLATSVVFNIVFIIIGILIGAGGLGLFLFLKLKVKEPNNSDLKENLYKQPINNSSTKSIDQL